MSMQPPYDIGYPSTLPPPYGSAPTLVKVAGVLNLVVAGLDVIYSLILLVCGVLFMTGVIPPEAFEDAGPGVVRHGPPPPMGIIGAVVLSVGLLALAVGVLKVIGGVKLLRRSRDAWGWTLASGIVGCTQLWCSYFCVIPMGVGIFTIVVACMENVRRYLREQPPGV